VTQEKWLLMTIEQKEMYRREAWAKLTPAERQQHKEEHFTPAERLQYKEEQAKLQHKMTPLQRQQHNEQCTSQREQSQHLQDISRRTQIHSAASHHTNVLLHRLPGVCACVRATQISVCVSPKSSSPRYF